MYGWQRYLSIEKEFVDARYYVSFSVENAFSEFFSREITFLGSEIETAFKELCYRINKSTPGNMGEYKEIIVKSFPGLVDVFVKDIETGKISVPFQDWDKTRLEWWDAYTGVKHNVVDATATLRIAVQMLQAYEILLFCIGAIEGDLEFNYLDNPKLYTPEFNPGMKLKGNMQIVLYYHGEDILNRIKKQLLVD